MKFRSHHVVLFALVMASAIGCNSSVDETNSKPVLSQEELVKRGIYLTTIGGCNDCHTPKIMTPAGMEPDPSRTLSGHPMDEELPTIIPNKDLLQFNMGFTAFSGPWGVSYAANLTPDDTGTGSWSFEQFKTAIRKGKYKGMEASRDLLPPMPWQMYRHMTDDDLKAVFAYLRTIKPIRNIVPAPIAPQDLVVQAQTQNQKINIR